MCLLNYHIYDDRLAERLRLNVIKFRYDAIDSINYASSRNNHNKDPEATTPETTTVNYTTTEYIPPENWIEMFIWDQNGTIIEKYVEIPHRKAYFRRPSYTPHQ